MKIKKEFLRESARLALRKKGYEVELAPGPGIVPGARLNAAKDGKSSLVAVRTSLDREVGLLRNQTGTWRTIPKMDLVIVAVPANDVQAVDVLAFDPNVLMGVFNATVDIVEKNKRNKARFKAPIFVALDDVKNSRTREVRPGLKKKAAWELRIPLDHSALRTSPISDVDPRAQFFDRLKQEVADFIGVDISKIVLEIRIIP
jgi:hypothetical protein